jgi:adenylate kinase
MSTSPASTASPTAAEQAAVIFAAAWGNIAAQVEAGSAVLPREIIWLGGAPGAGKGTNTNFILRARGISAPPIVTSSLLDSPEMRKIKDSGGLVGDREVVGLLFQRLTDPVYQHGVLIDGFPRSQVQVECVKLLYQKQVDLRVKHRTGTLAASFPKPLFQIVVLAVDEKESVERQLKRGRQIIAANARVRETGIGELQEERATDLIDEACRKRYRVFMEQTYQVLMSLREHFHFHIVNAQGDITSVERGIAQEFSYQSSLELDDETLAVIHHLPLANEVTINARQHLVRRLDSYQRDHADLFRRVVAAIDSEILPVIQLHAISGLAKIASENPLFAEPLALTMVVDVLNERGYRTSAIVDPREVPVRFDPATGAITLEKRPRYRFEVHFTGSTIRRGA